MARILGISGSLRRGSFNTALLREAATLMPDGSSLDIRTIHGIPVYNGDDETERGVPEPVAALKEAFAAADGVILATPEYNNSIPGAFKNAIDWMSRPPTDVKRVFAGKPLALVGASPGGFGTVLSQNAWLAVCRTLGVDLFTGGRVLVSRAGGVFDTNGVLLDDGVRQQLRVFLQGFSAFVESRRKDVG
jgi:chromate reductase, NAD(P)H dehydrogenase (quinone)